MLAGMSATLWRRQVCIFVLLVATLGFAAVAADVDGSTALVLARWTVGLVLVLAGSSKLTQLPSFARLLAKFPYVEKLARRSRPWAYALATTIAVTEVVLGSLLFTGLMVPVAEALTVTLLLAFSLGIAAALRSRRPINCGCLGNAERAVKSFDLVRNATLICTLIAGTGAPKLTTASEPTFYGSLIVVAVAGPLLWPRRNQAIGQVATRRRAMPRVSIRMITRRLSVVNPFKPQRITRRAAFEPEHVAELLETYADLRAKERESQRTLLELDRQLKILKSSDGADPALDDDRLFELDVEINERLAGLYRRSYHVGRDVDIVALRAALLHWHVLLRRRSMRAMHTVVDGLVGDLDCRGDVICDGLLVRYFDALFDHTGPRSEVAAIRALADLGRQSACLGSEQSAWLAHDLYWSFSELCSLLRAIGYERLVPYLVQAAANPLLIFYDVEKYRGIQAPLSRWFVEHRAALAEGVTNRRAPAAWHGLWLYDRRTGHMLGYQHRETVQDENDVNLNTFFASITQRENLGGYECSFTEMIERGPGKFGYVCKGELCTDSDAAPRRRGGSTRFTDRMRRGIAGLGLSSTATVGCDESGGGGGGRSGICGDAATVGGRSRMADVVRCISQQVIQGSQERRVIRCLVEATGMCADPIDRLTKGINLSTLTGIPIGRRCQIQSDDTTGGDSDDDTNSDTAKNTDEDVDKWSDELDRLSEEIRLAHDETIESQKVIDKWEAEQDEEDRGINPGPGRVKPEEYLAAVEKNESAKKREDEARKKRNALFEHGPGGAARRCPPDAPDCGDNSCTAMSEAARRTLSCFEHLGRRSDDLEGRTFGPGQPGVFDPSPLDDAADARWTPCLESLSNEADPAAPRCWAVDCGPKGLTAVALGGGCDCLTGHGLVNRPDGLRSQCGMLDCFDGVPVYANGVCGCMPQHDASNVFPEPPFHEAVTPLPQRFTDVRILFQNDAAYYRPD